MLRRVLKKSNQLGKANWDAVIHVYDEAGNVIETHEHKGEFKEPFVKSRNLMLMQNPRKSQEAMNGKMTALPRTF